MLDRSTIQHPPSLGLQDRNHVNGLNEVLVGGIFFGRQRARVRLLPQQFDLRLQFLVDPQVNDHASQLRRHRIGDGFKKSIEVTCGSHQITLADRSQKGNDNFSDQTRRESVQSPTDVPASCYNLIGQPHLFEETNMSTIEKIETADGLHWFHVNQQNYRLLTEFGIVERDEVFTRAHASQIVLTAGQITEMMGGRAFAAWRNHDYWSEAYARLTRVTQDGYDVAAQNNPTPCVPKSKLRAYRKSFVSWDTPLKLGQAVMFAARPELLKSLWNQSIDKIQSYNFQASFHNGGRNDLPPPGQLGEIFNTTSAAAFIQKHGIGVNGTDFRYLDREIAPLRTPGGVFEDGSPATSTGRGGMDLLLSIGSRICAGEVKVGNDSPLFDALLQVLWYASEIASDNQLRRIRDVYGIKDMDQSKVDAVVISISQPDDLTRQATLSIVDAINNTDGWNRLGKVHLIENIEDEWKPIRMV